MKPCAARRPRRPGPRITHIIELMSQNSFGAASKLRAGNGEYRVFPSVLARRERRGKCGPPALFDPNPAGEPAAQRGRPARFGRGRGNRGPRRGDRRQGDQLHAGARAAAGLHRRALRGGPGGHARCPGRHGRRPQPRQPAAAGRPGDRPLRAGGPLRLARTPSDSTRLLEFERNRERYALLRWGQTAFRNFRVVPPDTGIVHQVNLEYLAPVVFRSDGAGLPRFGGGHGFPHHHDQRPGRAGLGRGRHRSRGLHAGPADFHAAAAGGGIQTPRQAARKAAPPPTWC